jgi:histone H3/H4
MEIYTKQISLKISETQKQTLNKLAERNIKVSKFIRDAIAEKIQRDAKELIVKAKKVIIPF